MSTVKEADVLKHRGQVMSAMQKKDHNQLWLGLQNGNESKLNVYEAIYTKTTILTYVMLNFADKFDQFWAINRRLMESHGENEGFKHIPLRIYKEDGTFIQRLVNPKNSDGSRKIIQQMLSELYPDKPDGNFIFIKLLIQKTFN